MDSADRSESPIFLAAVSCQSHLCESQAALSADKAEVSKTIAADLPALIASVSLSTPSFANLPFVLPKTPSRSSSPVTLRTTLRV